MLGAARKAIAAVRRENGLDEHFKMPMPCTVDAIHKADMTVPDTTLGPLGIHAICRASVFIDVIDYRTDII